VEALIKIFCPVNFIYFLIEREQMRKNYYA